MVKVTAEIDLPDLHSVEETAEALGLSIATIWRRIRDGKLYIIRVAGRTLIPQREIDRVKGE